MTLSSSELSAQAGISVQGEADQDPLMLVLAQGAPR